jgi:hypothetical protein
MNVSFMGVASVEFTFSSLLSGSWDVSGSDFFAWLNAVSVPEESFRDVSSEATFSVVVSILLSDSFLCVTGRGADVSSLATASFSFLGMQKLHAFQNHPSSRGFDASRMSGVQRDIPSSKAA